MAPWPGHYVSPQLLSLVLLKVQPGGWKLPAACVLGEAGRRERFGLEPAAFPDRDSKSPWYVWFAGATLSEETCIL